MSGQLLTTNQATQERDDYCGISIQIIPSHIDIFEDMSSDIFVYKQWQTQLLSTSVSRDLEALYISMQNIKAIIGIWTHLRAYIDISLEIETHNILIAESWMCLLADA